MKKPVVLSILVMALGLAWLLNTLEVVPGVDWVWPIAIAGTGIVVFTVGGWNKASFVVGGFLVCAAIASVMRQTGRITLEREVPILVIVLGLLLLVSQAKAIPSESRS